MHPRDVGAPDAECLQACCGHDFGREGCLPDGRAARRGESFCRAGWANLQVHQVPARTANGSV